MTGSEENKLKGGVGFQGITLEVPGTIDVNYGGSMFQSTLKAQRERTSVRHSEIVFSFGLTS